MDNDQIGDCTCAAAATSSWNGPRPPSLKMATPTDKQIVAAYSAITGYNPTTGANDNGAQEIDVLNYWRQQGIGGHKIQAYIALEPSNHTQCHGFGLDSSAAATLASPCPRVRRLNQQ